MNNKSLFVYAMLIFSCKNRIDLLVCVSIFSHNHFITLKLKYKL